MTKLVRLAGLLVLALAGCRAPVKDVRPGPVPARVAASPVVRPHPLDPLGADELLAASATLRASGHLPEGALVPLLVLNEPPKAQVLAFDGSDGPRREALAVVLDRRANRTFEGIIDVGSRAITSWRELPGRQPSLTLTEFVEVPDVVRADARWQEALRRRGITDLDRVHLDVWAPGRVEDGGARLARALAFYRGHARIAYARPIEGVVAVVDLNAMQVVAVEDAGVVSVPPIAHDLHPAAIGVQRQAARPLRVVQPEGHGFEVRGQEVAWEGWRFRWALHPREGLVLYRVGYQDGERLRPIVYRAAVSEVVVPYGDPGPAWAWRGAFDEGEYGLGRFAFSLVPGADVPAHALLLDAVLADDQGAPLRRERVVGLYERDGGLLWRHLDEESGHVDARRARELVLCITVTIGNYDYGFSWVFGQDGALALEVELTGLLLAKAVEAPRCRYCPALAAGSSPAPEPVDTRFGTLVAPGVLAPNHQHFFCARLDLDVDGPKNSVVETEVRSVGSAGEAGGNAFEVHRTLLTSEKDARRAHDATTHRRWRVFNPGAPTPLGHLPGYVVLPRDSSVVPPAPSAAVRQRAGFVDHHLWVTRHAPGELYAAGDHPNQSPDHDVGVVRYAADDQPIIDEDVVLWYTFGVAHSPRVEEWPVMNAQRTGFRLVPDGFFTRNPALDVPPPR